MSECGDGNGRCGPNVKNNRRKRKNMNIIEKSHIKLLKISLLVFRRFITTA